MASVAALGVAGLVLGFVLVRWTLGAAPSAMSEGDPGGREAAESGDDASRADVGSEPEDVEPGAAGEGGEGGDLDESGAATGVAAGSGAGADESGEATSAGGSAATTSIAAGSGESGAAMGAGSGGGGDVERAGLDDTATPGTPGQPSDTRATATAPGDRASGEVELRRGRVAYLRCGGREPDCTRDARLEAAMWTILEGLPRCPRLAGQRGGADVRAHVTGAGTEVRFREWGDPPLALGALRGCLEAAVASVPRESTVTPLTVSFRVTLE